MVVEMYTIDSDCPYPSKELEAVCSRQVGLARFSS